jgi:hypothetical protein
MEHIRSARSSSAPPSKADAAPVALSALLEGVRSSSVGRQDVDALLAGLARPLDADESPQARADFLLSLLNSRHLCSMKGSQGLTVQTAAVRAIMELGHPYALEIPPEALDGPPRPSRASRGRGRRSIPVVGILLALIGTAPVAYTGILGFLLGAPTLAALFGGALQVRWLQRIGVALMALQGLSLFIVGGLLIYEDARSHNDLYDGLFRMFGMFALVPVPFLMLAAFLLRRPGWLIEDQASEEDEA